MGSIKLQLLRVIHISLIWATPSPLKTDLILFLEEGSQGGSSLLNKTGGLEATAVIRMQPDGSVDAFPDFVLPHLR